MQFQACDYAYPMDRLIQLFKYEQKLHLEPLLAGALLALKFPKVSAVVPMPISTERLVERGYNQLYYWLACCQTLTSSRLAAH